MADEDVPRGRATNDTDESLGLRYPTDAEIAAARRYAKRASLMLRDLFDAELDTNARDV